MAVISLRVVECILSAHTSDAHFLPGPSTLLAVIEVACIVPLVILLLGQVCENSVGCKPDQTSMLTGACPYFALLTVSGQRSPF